MGHGGARAMAAGETGGVIGATGDGADYELALLRRIDAGDRAAFRQLFLAYHRRLSRFLGRLTSDAQLIEELINDTMLVVWRKAGDFGARSRLSTWIFGIAYRLAMKALAARPGAASGRGPPDGVTSPAPLTAISPQREELQNLVEVALRGLPPEQRALLELAYFVGYSYGEIAIIIDCPVNTVKTRLFHARERLKLLMPTLTTRSATSLGEIME